jgi:hypothetical protein
MTLVMLIGSVGWGFRCRYATHQGADSYRGLKSTATFLGRYATGQDEGGGAASSGPWMRAVLNE